MMLQPSAANACAVAFPIPIIEPVTSAVFPSSIHPLLSQIQRNYRGALGATELQPSRRPSLIDW